MKIKKIILVLLSVCMILPLITSVVSADVADDTYKYGATGTGYTSPAVPGYVATEYLTGTLLGTTELNNPKDLFVDDNTGRIYISDSGNKRILVIERVGNEYKLVKEMSEFKNSDGGTVLLQEVRGIYVDKYENLYMADHAGKCVYVADKDGVIIRKLIKPETELLDEEYVFQPEKVLVNDAGIVYVLSYGAYMGAFSYDTDDTFLGFYGTNKVTVTAKMLLDRWWRQFLPPEKRKNKIIYKPVEFTSMDIDQENFIYTCTSALEVTRGQVRKLNPLGVNILWADNRKNSSANFGDLAAVDGKAISDVHIDDEGFITIIDEKTSRIFQYDQACNLLFILGGMGDQLGTFNKIAAIDKIGTDYLALDVNKNSITVFEPTEFGIAVREGVKLYTEGKYSESQEYFEEVIKRDPTYTMAYRGLGQAYLKQGEYEKAKEAFKFARDRDYYYKAFVEIRNRTIEKNFGWIALIIVLAILIPILINNARRGKPKKTEYDVKLTKWKIPFRIPFHPFGDYDEIKATKKGSLLVANTIFFVYVIIQYLTPIYTMYDFRIRTNILASVLQAVIVCVLFAVSNWLISTLFDGEGKLRDIWIFCCYALMPLIFITPIEIVLSNVLDMVNEGVFLNYLSLFKTVWFYLCIFLAIKSVHQYSVMKTIFTIIGTFIFILLIVFVLILIFTLFNQFFTFVYAIIKELSYR